MSNPASDHPRITVFDSGVGGLSILEEALGLLPGCRFDYLCDNGGFPYGTRSDAFVIERCHQVIDSYFHHCQQLPDMLVVACNTASTLALPRLRTAYSLPIVGVVPAIKPAASRSRTGTIGLLATPGTVKRDYTRQLIADYAAHCRVISHGSSALVQMAEHKLRGLAPDRQVLARELEVFTRASTVNPHPGQLDCLVLACTHFPLLKDEIQDCLGLGVQLLDSGEAIARRIHYWCDHLGYQLQAGGPIPGTVWFSAREPAAAAMRSHLDRLQLTSINLLGAIDPQTAAT